MFAFSSHAFNVIMRGNLLPFMLTHPCSRLHSHTNNVFVYSSRRFEYEELKKGFELVKKSYLRHNFMVEKRFFINFCSFILENSKITFYRGLKSKQMFKFKFLIKIHDFY